MCRKLLDLADWHADGFFILEFCQQREQIFTLVMIWIVSNIQNIGGIIIPKTI